MIPYVAADAINETLRSGLGRCSDPGAFPGQLECRDLLLQCSGYGIQRFTIRAPCGSGFVSIEMMNVDAVDASFALALHTLRTQVVATPPATHFDGGVAEESTVVLGMAGPFLRTGTVAGPVELRPTGSARHRPYAIRRVVASDGVWEDAAMAFVCRIYDRTVHSD